VTSPLEARIASGLARSAAPEVVAFGGRLAAEADACAVLFYGSNLRTGLLEGVLDYYVLTDAPPERGIWPRVSYREWPAAGQILRAKIATMSLAKFREATSGTLLDTTIWTRFVQPSALVWKRDEAAEAAVVGAIAAASMTASRLAAVLGPAEAPEEAYWIALFEATYKAEFRIETTSRARSVYELNQDHFNGLLPLALEAAGIACTRSADGHAPRIEAAERRRVKRWWARRRRTGKAINLLRLLRAASTFDGAARYAAWKIERHSGVRVELTPWRERHPVLAAPGVLWSVWKETRRGR